MAWDDDSWKDGYDSWKLASPYDDEDPCDHEEYESDVLTGRAICNMCGHAWWLTTDELNAEHRRNAEYGEWVAEQHRLDRWEWLMWPWRWIWYRFLMRVSPHGKAVSAPLEDDLPF